MLDVIHRSTIEAGTDLRRTQTRTKQALAWAYVAGCHLALRLIRGTVRAGIDLAVQRVAFVARRDDTTTIVEQGLISPRIELGLAAYFP